LQNIVCVFSVLFQPYLMAFFGGLDLQLCHMTYVIVVEMMWGKPKTFIDI